MKYTKDPSIIEGIPQDVQQGLDFFVVEIKRAIPMPWVLQTFPQGMLLTNPQQVRDNWEFLEDKRPLEVALQILEENEGAIVILVECLEEVGRQLKAGYFTQY